VSEKIEQPPGEIATITTATLIKKICRTLLQAAAGNGKSHPRVDQPICKQITMIMFGVFVIAA
jgi:hypothetical protein